MPRPFTDIYRGPTWAILDFLRDYMRFFPGLNDSALKKREHVVVQWGRTSFHNNVLDLASLPADAQLEFRDGMVIEYRGKKFLRVPGVYVGFKRMRQRQVGMGNSFATGGDGDNKPVLMHKANMELDIWAKTNLDSHEIGEDAVRAFFEYRQSVLQEKGFIDIELTDMHDMGFDLGDRILQSHSHQEFPVIRLKLGLDVEYLSTPPGRSHGTGGVPITRTEITLDHQDTLAALGTVISGSETVYYLMDDMAGMELLEVG